MVRTLNVGQGAPGAVLCPTEYTVPLPVISIDLTFATLTDLATLSRVIRPSCAWARNGHSSTSATSDARVLPIDDLLAVEVVSRQEVPERPDVSLTARAMSSGSGWAAPGVHCDACRSPPGISPPGSW